MDHNISGKTGPNRDHSDPEDKIRENTGPDVQGSNETEAGSGQSGDQGVVQGSLDPQDPSAERAYQGSLDPQDPSAEKEYQGSLDPQGSTTGTRKQGSLNPQYSEQQKTVQGSLDPQAASGRKDVQGRLSSGSGTQKAAKQGSVPAGTGKGASGAIDARKGEAPAGVQGTLSEAVVTDASKDASGAASKDASGAVSKDASGTVSKDASGTVSKDASGAASKDASGAASKDASGAASKDASGTASKDASGAASETAAADALAAAAAGAARISAAAGPTEAETEAGTWPAETGAEGTAAGTGTVPAFAAAGTSPAEAGAKGSSAAAGTAVTYVPTAGQSDEEEQKEEKKKKKSHRKALAFWISFLFILLLLGGVYYGGYKYCETHFMPGSTINGYDCSGLTEEEAEKRFADAADKYTLDIRFRGGSTEVLTAQDIGFAYKPDGSIGAMIYGQDRTLWPRYFFEDYSYTLDLGGNYDPDLLTSALAALPELQEENMQKPEDAYIQFMDGNETEDGSFQIVPDNPGNTIDLVQLAAGAGDAAARYEQEIDAEQIAGAYKEAALKADDAELAARCKDLNDLVGASITYTLPDHTELKLNSDVMKDWLVRDEKGRLVKDDEVWDEKIWKFMELLAYNCNTIGIDREFNSTERGEITVTGGDYGYMVNQIVEHDLLVKDLAEGKVETRKPSYYISAYNDETENDGIGKTYMEVDLTAQHMWCYIDGKMVLESDCVTGDPTTKHETPTGVFGIMFMKKDATLRGIQQKNGKYEYETKVKYWMPFYNDCGFHDAWWRTAFGGEIYKGDGSHGCVNLPSEAAEKLFSYCEDKMPVVIYK